LSKPRLFCGGSRALGASIDRASAKDEDGTGGEPHNAFGYAAEAKMLKACSSVRRYNNQVHATPSGKLRDGRYRFA
jgi:hypothetical protein